MGKIVRKANAVFLGLLTVCGIGLSLSNMRKVIADTWPGCPDTIATGECSIPYWDPVAHDVHNRCRTNTVNSQNCCQYEAYWIDCRNPDTGMSATFHHEYYFIVGPNANRTCGPQGRCVS